MHACMLAWLRLFGICSAFFFPTLLPPILWNGLPSAAEFSSPPAPVEQLGGLGLPPLILRCSAGGLPSRPVGKGLGLEPLSFFFPAPLWNVWVL